MEKEIDIPTWKMNEILWEEGFRNEMLGVVQEENISKRGILDITIGFALAQREINRMLKDKQNGTKDK